MTTLSKIAERHLSRDACIYIRQSTPGQVRFNQESTERQYNLKSKAEQLGWRPERIRVLDRDLGQSGARMTHREDFKALVGEVAMSQIGAIFSLEASRLARSNQDWHRLLELCAITGTLVIDEDGCYDPAEFNDGLVLGMKGTFAQAELHIIRARLHGGKINKAVKGELRFPLPVGLVFDGEGIVLDPDQEVQGAVRTVFELFEREGTAYGVVQRFQELGLRFPRRSYGGAWDGKLLWGRLTHSRALGILANPFYAGAYVFGRRQSCKQLATTGEIETRSRLVPQDEWRVVILSIRIQTRPPFRVQSRPHWGDGIGLIHVVHRRDPRATRSALTSDVAARVGGSCAPTWVSPGGGPGEGFVSCGF